MPVQTIYDTNIAPAYEGMIANSEDITIVSKQVQTVAGIGFGKPAFQGTQDDQIKAVNDGSAIFRGITVGTHFGSQGLADLYARYETCPVMVQGVLWVQASVAVAVGDLVYFVPATGVWTNVATANTLVQRATWDSSTTGPGLAKLRIQ
jgi:hypothetical protein